MKETKKWTRWLYWFVFAVAVIFVYKTLDNFNDISIWFNKLLSILMPFLMGILVAYLFYIPCRQIESLYKKLKPKFIKKRARTLSIITVYIMAILLLAIIINIIIPALSESVVELANSMPGYYNTAMEYVENMPEDAIIKKADVLEIIANIYGYIKGVVGVAQGIFSVFVTLIMSVYILAERSQILKFVRRLNSAIFKDKTCKIIDKYFMKANDIFFKFVSSQVLDGIIVGIIVSIAMWILGVKYWVLLGFMIGLFNIIPYFGAIVAVVIASIITIFTGGFAKAIWMVIVVVILQQIDANIINPKIVGNALQLSPILVIFSVTLFGAYFGVLGMFLAVPIIAVIKLITNDFIDYRTKKKKQEEKL